MTIPPRFHAVYPGGASHVATIAGSALELDKRGAVVGVAGVSAGGLVAIAHAFDRLDDLPGLLRLWLQKNRLLDVVPDGRIGICAHRMVPRIIDELIGPGRKMGEASIPLCLVVTRASRPVYLSSWATPDVLVSHAGRGTSALVPLFPMVEIPSLGTALSPDVVKTYDGGFVDNLPDHVFDGRVDPTVSVSLRPIEPTTGRADRTGDDPLSQAMDILGAVTFAPAQRKTRRTDGRHIVVDAYGSGLDFNLSVADIDKRIESGRRGVRAALEGTT